MKRILLLILIITQVDFIIAQSLLVTGDTVVTGSALNILENHFDVVNTSSSNMTVVCRKTNILQTTGTISFCWANKCYTADTSSQYALILAGQIVADSNSHVAYYDGWGTPSTAVVEYCFYDLNNPLDETCRTVTYIAESPASISASSHLNRISEFSPNPSQYYTTVQCNLIGETSVRIIDILGNEVKNISLNDRESRQLYIGDLSKGIYFGNFIYKNEVVAIKKLVVK